ncbi:MAG: AsnC family transcriptional regulator [Oscillospiraceae bacterium]
MVFDSLDPVDQQLIELLIKNARSSYSELAAQVGLSRVAVKARIDALEKSGIIEEYTRLSIPRKSAAPYPYLSFRFSEHLDTVISACESDIVTQLYRMTGRAACICTRWQLIAVSRAVYPYTDRHAARYSEHRHPCDPLPDQGCEGPASVGSRVPRRPGK